MVAAAAAAPPNYHIIILGNHLEGVAKVLDINNRNQIVGYVFGYDSMRAAFAWRNGAIQMLSPLGPGCESVAEGINDSGQMVGFAYTQPGRGPDDQRIFHAVMWDTAGVITDLGAMGGYRSVAFDINNKGQVAGFFSTLAPVVYSGVSPVDGGYDEHVYVWEKGAYRALAPDSSIYGHNAQDCFNYVRISRDDNLMTPLYISPYYSLVDEITLNNNGDVASTVASNWRQSYSVLWKAGGRMVDLNASLLQCGYNPDSSLFEPMDLNDSLEIAGFLLTWSVKTGLLGNQVTRTFSTLEWVSPVACYKDLQLNKDNTANEPGINNKGMIAGTYNSNPTKAVVWENDSVFPLENYVLGRDTMTYHTLDEARVINDSGVIAGEGVFG